MEIYNYSKAQAIFHKFLFEKLILTLVQYATLKNLEFGLH